MLKPDFPRRRPFSDAVRPHLISLASLSFQTLTISLLARARLTGELSPFAPACFSAGLIRGWNPWVMLLGCALGCFSSGTTVLDALPLISCAAVCALHFAARLVRRFFPDIEDMQDFLTGLFAGASLLIPALLLSGGIRYNILTASLCAVVSALLAPALTGGMGVSPSRRLLMPEEQLSLSLLAMLLLIGLRAAPYAGEFLSSMAAALFTLLFSGAGAGMGALAGLAAGTALTLGGSNPFMGATLCLCGLLAGCVRTLPRIGACIALLLGNLLTVSWGLGFTVGSMDYLPALAGCAAYCLLPSGAVLRLRGWMSPVYPRADPERMAVRLRRKAGRRLGEVSEVFGELADGYGERAVLPTEQQLISEMRKALCEGCEGYAACWQGDSAQAGRLMCRMAAEALTGQEITHARDLPPDLLRHCRRSAQIDRSLLPLMARLAQERRSELKRSEARALMARQFRQAQHILDSLSTQMKSEACLNREYAELARAALDRAGLRVKDVTALLDDRLEIVCMLADGIWNPQSAHHVAALLTDELGIPFSPVLSRGRVPGECELRLMQAPALTAAIGTAFCPAADGAPCGDSHIAQLLPDGRLIAAISDGMGHGEQAAQESRKCISLLRKFVIAGLDRDAALTAANSILMLQSGEDMFATADLCVVDLYSGVAAFSKLGACRSFILGERGVREVAGGRLPLGILDQVEPASERAEVHPGDMLVMISDGIADDLKEGQMEALRGQLRRARHLKPEQAAQSVLSWAKARDAGAERDDMTVIAVRILARRLRVR